ncbi:hypothetical protein [Polaromonas sp. YR568]|uniref:hypothetical protein n=1 Tax=Polaromonas sp. YR568 TaxID=1855301 RepID=UPI00398C0EB3
MLDSSRFSAVVACEPGAGAYKGVLKMMYFIELSQFSVEDSSLAKVLRDQMGLSKGNAVRWAEWHAAEAGPDSWPDVTLINAARLDWRQLKAILDQCAAETVVLTGRHESLFALPTLSCVAELDDLLQFMPPPGFRAAPGLPTLVSGSQRRFAREVDTTPMPLNARP